MVQKNPEYLSNEIDYWLSDDISTLHEFILN